MKHKKRIQAVAFTALSAVAFAGGVAHVGSNELYR